LVYIRFILGSIGKKHVSMFLSCILVSLLLTGCHHEAVKSLPDNAAVGRALCQVKQSLVIGFYAGPNLVVLDSCHTDPNHSVTLEKNPPRSYSTYNYSSLESPDGKWQVKVDTHQLTLLNRSTMTSRVAVQATKILTHPQWAPDSNFVFVVTSENRDRSRSFLQCADDIFEIYVVNAKSGNGTIMGRVCAGVPIDAFRWIQKVN
jgi:hypothetical protein